MDNTCLYDCFIFNIVCSPGNTCITILVRVLTFQNPIQFNIFISTKVSLGFVFILHQYFHNLRLLLESVFFSLFRCMRHGMALSPFFSMRGSKMFMRNQSLDSINYYALNIKSDNDYHCIFDDNCSFRTCRGK